jgi:hypothetical protein
MHYKQTLGPLRSTGFSTVSGNLRLGRNSEIFGNPYHPLFVTDPHRSACKSKSTVSTKTFVAYFAVDVQALYPDKTIVSVLVASSLELVLVFPFYFLLPVRYLPHI